ncbi:hypothetical protein FKW77_007930 [Venturia effusa]|uniref:Uncharacterized protein n=1 Tax=Venturia effusa TaxID=50376 RepID=A0A517LJ85_9PEZI|nr:hypothetical protein FKW77_007930 [Venturia effusa]
MASSKQGSSTVDRFPSHERIHIYAAASEIDLTRGFCKDGPLSFDITGHQDPKVYPTELHYIWEVKCCHECVRRLSFDWVAVTEGFPMPAEDKQWLRKLREQEHQDKLAAEASKRGREDSSVAMDID